MAKPYLQHLKSRGASFILRNIFMLIGEGADNDARSGPIAGI